MPPLPFVSPTSANALISDVRPTTLTQPTLAFINAILDELLVSIVTAARSINPTDLRTRGVATVLAERDEPDHLSLGALGRAAVGEAEVEIRSWYEGHPTANKGVSGFPPDGEGTGLAVSREADGAFPTREAVELMRLKVAMFSTFAPQSPPTEQIDDVLDAWILVGGDDAEETIAPAGLWLTAVLEHICEHILSKLSQVVARDSSLTAARIQDLYTALCEDDSVYTFFKRMGAKPQLEQAIKTAPQNRSRSQRVTSMYNMSAPPRSSPPATLESPYGSRTSLSNPAAHGDHRKQASATSTGSRPSSEQFYKKGSAPPTVVTNGHKRAGSVLSLSTRQIIGAFADTDSTADTTSKQQRVSNERASNDEDFDALLRSGETMRVSLTPSRFSTFETSPTASPPRVTVERTVGAQGHLSAPSSSESSLLSSSTQASTVESQRMGPTNRQTAGRSWQSTAKLLPRDATIEEKSEEEPFGQSVMELLKTEPKTPVAPQIAQVARTVPAVILGSPIQSAHSGSSPRASVSTLPNVASSRSEQSTPEPPFRSQRDGSVGGAGAVPEVVANGTNTSQRARPARIDTGNRMSDTRALAQFLKTPPIDPPPPAPAAEDDLPPVLKTTKSKMSFKNIMSNMKKSGAAKKEDGSKKSLKAPSASSSLRAPSPSGPLRSQRSTSSFTSNSTAIPSVAEDNVPPAKTKPMELLRKPSLVRKWATQVTSEPSRSAGRRRGSPRSINSSLPPVQDDEIASQTLTSPSHQSLEVNTGPSGLGLGALGFGPGVPESFSFRTIEEVESDPDVGQDREAALAQLTANSRQNSPIVARTPELEDLVHTNGSTTARGSKAGSVRGSPRLSRSSSLRGSLHQVPIASPVPVPFTSPSPSGSPQLRNSPLHQRVLELAREGDDAATSAPSTIAAPVALAPPSESGSAVSAASFTSATSTPMGSPDLATVKAVPSVASPYSSPRSGTRSTTAVSLSGVSTASVSNASAAEGYVPVADLVPIRHLLDNATSVRECQLLVDAILSQLGVPRTAFGGTIARPEDRVAAWLLAGREGPVGDFRPSHPRNRKSVASKRSKRPVSRLSPDVTMKNLPDLPPPAPSPVPVVDAAAAAAELQDVTLTGEIKDEVEGNANDVSTQVSGDAHGVAGPVVDLGSCTSLPTVTAPSSPIAPTSGNKIDIDAEAHAVAAAAAEDRLNSVSALVIA